MHLRRTPVILWLFWVAVLGCSGGRSNGPNDSLVGGQSGGELPGQGGDEPECTEDAPCYARAEDLIKGLRNPSAAPTRTTSSSQCSIANVIGGPGESVSGTACTCSGNAGDLTIGPVGLTCYLRGRAGNCLMADSDFQGCSTTDGRCESVCGLADARINADLARSFSAEVRQASCIEDQCRSIVEIEGACYEGDSFRSGSNRDCDAELQEVPSVPPSATASESGSAYLESTAPYREGTAGSVWLTVDKRFYGSSEPSQSFWMEAQFVNTTGASTNFGEVLDPLERIDDCRVFEPSSLGLGASQDFFPVTEAVLIDGSQHYVLEEFSSGIDFYSYSLDLTAQFITPRYEGTYGFAASGGELASALDSVTIALPKDLEFTGLQQIVHQPRGDLDLVWTGDGVDPLLLSLSLTMQLGNIFLVTTQVDCVVQDDGAFVIPASVLDYLPDGELHVTASRAFSALSGTGAMSLLTRGQVSVTHNLAFGERCERANVREACLTYAEALHAAELECGLVETPIEHVCPGYLATWCATCPEYYTCRTETVTCGSDGYVQHGVCSCQ